MKETEPKPEVINAAVALAGAILFGYLGILLLFVGFTVHWELWTKDIACDNTVLHMSWVFLVSLFPLWCSALLLKSFLYRRKGWSVSVQTTLSKRQNIISCIILLPASALLSFLASLVIAYYANMTRIGAIHNNAGMAICIITIIGAFVSFYALAKIIRQHYRRTNNAV